MFYTIFDWVHVHYYQVITVMGGLSTDRCCAKPYNLIIVVEIQSHAWTSHECMVAPGHMGITTTHPQSQSRCSDFKLGVVSYLKCSLTTSVLESRIDILNPKVPSLRIILLCLYRAPRLRKKQKAIHHRPQTPSAENFTPNTKSET